MSDQPTRDDAHRTRPADAPGTTRSRFAVPIDAFEDAVRVRADDHVVELAAPPAEMPIAPEELDRQTLLGVTGAGRLRLP